MLKKIVYLVMVLAFGVPAFAQSVTISPRKTVYRRPKPLHDFKKTFTVVRPVAKAATPALSRRITAAISPERVLHINIREEQIEYQWLEETNYKVLYNRSGVLCIELWMMGTGAYPDSVTKTVVVDIARGVPVGVADSFSDLDRLAPLVKKRQDTEITGAKREMMSDPDARPEELFAESNFTVKDFRQFAVDAEGVTFIYDYGFPHVLEALEPDGRYHFTWTEITPFVKPGGLLARFVH